MVHYVLGEKGSGKTKWLIDRANEDMKSGNGNVIFIDVEDDHIYSLDYNVRLINAMDYKPESLEAFYGFLCGILSMDYDVEKIYIDSIYKIFPLTKEELTTLDEKLEAVGARREVEFFINADLSMEDMPEILTKKTTELKK